LPLDVGILRSQRVSPRANVHRYYESAKLKLRIGTDKARCDGGVAASVAGLVSLGLQITEGIVKYVDGFKSHDSDLAWVKDQTEAVRASLTMIEPILLLIPVQSVGPATPSPLPSLPSNLPSTGSIPLQSVPAATSGFSAAVSANLELFKKALTKADKVYGKLAVGGSGTRGKLADFTYPFHRPQVQELAKHLHEANSCLQLVLASLNLDSSLSSTKELRQLHSQSVDHGAELRRIHSTLSATQTPISDMHIQLPLVQDGISETNRLVVSQSQALQYEFQAGTLSERQEISQTQSYLDAPLEERFADLATLLRTLQQSDERPQSPLVLASRASSKPETLKMLCDSVRAPEGLTATLPETQQFDYPLRSPQSGVTRVKICACPSLRKGATARFGSFSYRPNTSSTNSTTQAAHTRALQ
jgi:hypothetical protein